MFKINRSEAKRGADQGYERKKEGHSVISLRRGMRTNDKAQMKAISLNYKHCFVIGEKGAK